SKKLFDQDGTHLVNPGQSDDGRKLNYSESFGNITITVDEDTGEVKHSECSSGSRYANYNSDGSFDQYLDVTNLADTFLIDAMEDGCEPAWYTTFVAGINPDHPGTATRSITNTNHEIHTALTQTTLGGFVYPYDTFDGVLDLSDAYAVADVYAA